MSYVTPFSEARYDMEDDDYRAKIERMEIEMCPIGKVGFDAGEVDEYVLLKRLDDNLTEKQAHDWLLWRVYRRCERPGGYFCDRVRIVRETGHADSVIAIIEHRWDV